MIEQNSITIIGKGAVGGVLYDFFKGHSYSIRSVWDSKQAEIRSIVDNSIAILEKNLPTEEHEMGDIIFICVPDDQIGVLCDNLAQTPLQWENRSIVHCSGNLASDSCSSLKNRGASVAAMHPIQTFRKGDRFDRLKDIYITLEGDDELILDLESIIDQMGAHSLQITAAQKTVIHIASVIASNYLVALMHISDTLLKDAGVQESLEIIQPLVNQTVHNIFKKGVNESLTGPISRGDFESVQHHLNQLEKNHLYSDIYKLLGVEALSIVQENKSLDKQTINQFIALLGR